MAIIDRRRCGAACLREDRRQRELRRDMSTGLQAPPRAVPIAGAEEGRRKPSLLATLVCLIMITGWEAGSWGGQAPPIVWTAPSLVRIGQGDPPGPSIAASIAAARGESESFQVAIRAPAGGLSNVNVTPSGLAGPDGSHLDAANLTLYREHYVYVNRSSPDRHGPNKPIGAGWYPDALVPFHAVRAHADSSGALGAVPFDLPEAVNAVVWVDVHVPRATPAGRYRGHLSVTSDQGEVEVPLSVLVWNFTLPKQPALDSAFLFWTTDTLESRKELLRHRLQPLKVAPEQERLLIDDYGLKSTALGFWSGADITTCRLSAAPSVDAIRRAMARHQPDLQLYNFTADEIDDCVGVQSALREWGRNLHLAGPGNRNLVAIPPDPALFDDGLGSGRSAVDIWAILPRNYDHYRSLVRQVQSKGDDVWSYTALVQDSYSPKWLIDFAPINFRIMPGFINQSLGLTGLLYWRVDRWKADPWHEVNNSGDFGADNYPGDGMLVYPGAAIGQPGTVVASMRLKWLRDGVDDYDYVELLKQRGQGEWALNVTRSIAPDWRSWTRDADALEAARTALGQRLQDLACGRPRADGAAGC
jgi:Glycoside hydrolase 123, catalytic domain/Glycoside hydrolase 123 N-terminal domain